MATQSCTVCQTILDETPGFALCKKCGAPVFSGDMTSPFDVFSVPKTFDLNEGALEDQYYKLSRILHPDRFASQGTAVKQKSQELAAVMNQAYSSLRKHEDRLETLLTSVGAIHDEAKSQSQGKLPMDLAEEFFELQEAVLDESENSKSMAQDFRQKLENLSKTLTEQIYTHAGKTDWSKPSDTNIAEIVELRRERSYLRSMLENLKKLGV